MSKKLKSEIMSVDITAKKIIKKDETRWKDTRSKYLNDIIKKSDDVIYVPNYPNYIGIADCKTPTVHSKCIWLSKNSGVDSAVEVWAQKPKKTLRKIKNSKGKKVETIYYSTGDSPKTSGVWINTILSYILFGILPKEKELIGPIYITSEIIKNEKKKI
jgi:hypothetical protein